MEPFARPRDAAVDARLSEVAAFGPNPGALRMLTYLPRGLRAGAPLVVALHGCGQSAEAFAVGAGWTDLADRIGFALLCPEQVRANNRGRCFNWFRPADVRGEGGEAASIRHMVEHLLARARLDRRRVFAVGLSAGGSMAVALLATSPKVFAAGAVISGVAYGAAANAGGALLAMSLGPTRAPATLAHAAKRGSSHAGPWPRLSVWQGLDDRTVAPVNAQRIIDQWLDLHGLDPIPSRVETLPGQTVSRWSDPRGGAVLELRLIEGLGHGAPLAAAGPDGLGEEGPFLLETGVSSALEIAKFWGLLEKPRPRAKPAAPRRLGSPGEPSRPRGWWSIGGRLSALVRRVLGRER